MWATFIIISLYAVVSSRNVQINSKTNSIFRDEQIIFSSEFNISKVLVPADGDRYVQRESTEMPSIFFTVNDPKLEGGSCIYVLEGFAAYEILEGGRDSSSDYSSDKTVYFGARDGLYIYNPDSLSAKRLGPFRDNIIQLQKANGTDVIYILTNDSKIYKIEKNGTVKTRVTEVVCATEFVLDTSNNLYFISCGDQIPHILRMNDLAVLSVMEEFREVQLLRPAFIMEKCVPYFGDDVLHILYANGTSEKKDFYLREKPSAFSVDAALYLVAALNGKIYEFNVMEVLLKSMFGVSSEWPRDITKIVMSIIETSGEGVFGFYKGWNRQ